MEDATQDGFYLVALEPLPTCIGKFLNYSEAKEVEKSMKVEADLIQEEIPLRECWTTERRRQLWIALTQPTADELMTMHLLAADRFFTDEEIYDALKKHAKNYEPKPKSKKRERIERVRDPNAGPKRVVQKGAVAKVVELFNATPFRWDDKEAKAKTKVIFDQCVAAGVNKSTAAGNIRRLARKLQSEQDLAAGIDASLKQS